MKKSVLHTLFVTISLSLILGSCIHDNFEEPPIVEIPVGIVLSLDEIYQIYYDSVVGQNLQYYKFTEDYSVYATIIMDDKSGNIYKSAYIQDLTRGINLHMMASGGLYEGDSVRLYLNGLIISEYAGMMQIDSVRADKNIVKIATLNHIEPIPITIDQIFTGQYLAKLVRIDNVQFVSEDLGTSYADKENLITLNKTIEDEFGQTMIVRTSGYSSFAANAIPQGRGSITAVVGKFNTDWQLLIRSAHEVEFDQRRFGDVDTVFSEDFANIEHNTEISLENWHNITQTGALKWLGFNTYNPETQDGANYAKIEGTGNEAMNYLILPKQNLNNSFISFKTRAGMLLNAKLELVISSDFDPETGVEAATWQVVNALMATSSSSSYGTWTESGDIELNQFNGEHYVAFRFNAESGQRGVFLLDNVLVFTQ